MYDLFPTPIRFIISLDELLDGEDIGNCPSCTLKIRVIYDDYSLDKYLQLKEAAQTTEVKSEATEE